MKIKKVKITDSTDKFKEIGQLIQEKKIKFLYFASIKNVDTWFYEIIEKRNKK